MEPRPSFAPAEAIDVADSSEADFDFDDFLNESGVDQEARNATLAELEATYGGRVFHYGQYSGTVADMAASCPAFSDILEQGVGAASNWLEANDEPEVVEEDEGETEQNADKADDADDEPTQRNEPQQDSRQAEQAKELQLTVNDQEQSIVDVVEDAQYLDDKTKHEPSRNESLHGEIVPDAAPTIQLALEQSASATNSETPAVNIQMNMEHADVVQDTSESPRPIALAVFEDSQDEPERLLDDKQDDSAPYMNNELVQVLEADAEPRHTDTTAVVSEATIEQGVVAIDLTDDGVSFAVREHASGDVVNTDAGDGNEVDIVQSLADTPQVQESAVQEPVATIKETTPDEVDLWHASDEVQESSDHIQPSVEKTAPYDNTNDSDAYENNNFAPELMGEQDGIVSGAGQDSTVEYSEDTEPLRLISSEVIDIVAELTGQTPDQSHRERTIDLYTQASATIRAIETLEKARTAEDCRKSLELLREELETLLQRLGYADARAMAERLTQHYDIASLKKYIMLLNRTFMLEQMKDEKPQTLSTKLDVPYHRYGAQAVRMVVDFAKSSVGYQNAAA